MDFIYYNYSALIKGEYFFGGGFGMYVWGLRLGYVVCMGLFVDYVKCGGCVYVCICICGSVRDVVLGLCAVFLYQWDVGNF